MRTTLSVSSLVALTSLLGCATVPAPSVSQEASMPAGFDNPQYQDLVRQSTSAAGPTASTTGPSSALAQITSPVKKAAASVAGAMTPKPRVVPADDPVSLLSKPGKLTHDVHFRAARMCENRGDSDEARQHYEAAIQLKPRDVMTLVSLARLHDRQRNYQEAEKWYRQAIEANGNDPMPHNDLGLCYARQNQLDRSLAQLEQAVQLDPRRPLYRINFAAILVRAGQREAALDQLLAVHPPALAHQYLATLLVPTGDRAAAMAHVRTALQHDPSMPAARDLLARLEAQPAATQQAAAPAPEVNPNLPAAPPSSIRRLSAERAARHVGDADGGDLEGITPVPEHPELLPADEPEGTTGRAEAPDDSQGAGATEDESTAAAEPYNDPQ